LAVYLPSNLIDVIQGYQTDLKFPTFLVMTKYNITLQILGKF